MSMEELTSSKRSTQEKRPFAWRRFLPQFSIASMMWLCLVTAICILWYRDHSRLVRQVARFYGVESTNWASSQIVGPADTRIYGDIPSAWASRTPDMQEEWIIVEFPRTVSTSQIAIHESYNPGAVTKIYSVSMFGAESLIWEGTDPLVSSLPLRQVSVSQITLDTPMTTRRIKIVIDSKNYPGWNEIDAVELIDVRGNRQWASQAWTSTSFGKNSPKPSWYFP